MNLERTARLKNRGMEAKRGPGLATKEKGFLGAKVAEEAKKIAWLAAARANGDVSQKTFRGRRL